MFRIIFFLLFSFYFLQAKPLKIVYVAPTIKSHQFFSLVDSFAKEVAKDLEIDFHTEFPKDNLTWAEYYNFLESVYKKADKPDFIIAFLYRKEGKEIFEIAEKYAIPTVLLNSYVAVQSDGCSSYPREVYDTYHSAVVANEKSAGYLLAKELVEQAKKQKKTINVIGLGGSRRSGESIQRNLGLEEFAYKDKNVNLQQIFFADWNPDKAYEMTKHAFERYSDIDVIWSASDTMALAAKKALNHLGKTDVLVGGIDWSKEGIDALKEGYMDASVGGHYLNGGIALILLYDYFYGKDFKEELGLVVSLDMSVLNKESVKGFEKSILISNPDKIDFRKYSKVLNPKLKKYDFSLEKFLK